MGPLPAPRHPSLARALVALVELTLTACGARSGLGDRPYATPGLACTDVPAQARPSRPVRLYASVPLGALGVTAWSVTTQPAGAHVTLTDDHGDSALFQSDAEGAYTVRVTVPRGTSGADGGVGDGGPQDFLACTLSVVVRASGPTAVCPPSVTTQPLHPVSLVGSALGDRSIRQYGWSVASAPVSSGRPPPSPDDAATTMFTPDSAGDYTLRLTVTDDAGAQDACTTVVHAIPQEALRVEMYWDPPGRTCPTAARAACDSSDLDVHLLRASAARGWGTDDDCYWYNCNASAMRFLHWPGTSTGADPFLDLDNVMGHGPENIRVEHPIERSYRIGVHYYDAHGAGDEAATVLVFCSSSSPTATIGPVTLRSLGGYDLNDFWLVADVLPSPGGGCTVQPIHRDGGTPFVVPWNLRATETGPPAP